MDQYIKNILPRIQAFSKNLNKKELFVGKSWIQFNENLNIRIEYTFCRDNTLIKSENGIAHEGTWKLLPTGKLVIKVENISIQLENIFLNEGAFILSISGDSTNGLVFFNENVVKNNLVKYLESLEKSIIESEPSLPENSDDDIFNVFIVVFVLGILILALFKLI
jgi:hypothetical protein